MQINIFSENIHPNLEVDEKKALDTAKKILKFYLKDENIFNSSCLKELTLAENSQSNTQTKADHVFEECERQIVNCISFDILYCDNKKTHEINREYRKKDYPADIITFAVFADSEEKFIFDGEINLGEIIISLDKVAEKGKWKRVNGKWNETTGNRKLEIEIEIEMNNNYELKKIHSPFTIHHSPFEDELNFLIAHGIMHLLGFDHQTEEDYTFIIQAQNAALKSLEVQHGK